MKYEIMEGKMLFNNASLDYKNKLEEQIKQLQKENEELKGIWKLEESIAQTRAKEIFEDIDKNQSNQLDFSLTIHDLIYKKLKQKWCKE